MEEFLYKCYYDRCNKSYRTKYNLRRHINSNHLCIKEFSCPICSKTFASKQNLQGHENLHKQQVSMPEFEIPLMIKNTKKSKCEDIREFILSTVYKEPLAIYSINNNVSKIVMPILPPISNERSSSKENIKLPVIPILL